VDHDLDRRADRGLCPRGRGSYRLTVTDITEAGFVFDPDDSILSRSIMK
jgi:hypothetical protein